MTLAAVTLAALDAPGLCAPGLCAGIRATGEGLMVPHWHWCLHRAINPTLMHPCCWALILDPAMAPTGRGTFP